MDKSNVTLYCDLEQGNPPTLHAVRWYDYDGNDEKRKNGGGDDGDDDDGGGNDDTQLICFNANCHPPCFAEN